jgi:hypothetical protein
VPLYSPWARLLICVERNYMLVRLGASYRRVLAVADL